MAASIQSAEVPVPRDLFIFHGTEREHFLRTLSYELEMKDTLIRNETVPAD